MARRGISEQQVERCVRRPDVERPAKREGARRMEKRLSARIRLIVIAEETDRNFWVITAFKQ